MNLQPDLGDEVELLDAEVKPSTVNPFQFQQQMDAAMSRFLVVELEVGLTFAKAAINAHWTQELLHNRKLARKAYDTATRLMNQAKLTEAEAKGLDSGLQSLKLALSQLGDQA